MEYVKWGKRYLVLKEKGRLFRVNDKLAEYIYRMGMDIGFNAGVRRTEKYISRQLNAMKKISKKTKKIIQKNLLINIDVKKVKQYPHKEAIRLLAAIFGEKTGKIEKRFHQLQSKGAV